MGTLKKIYEMIELHDNERLKYVIDDNFNPKGYPYKINPNNTYSIYSFIKLAICCNNFEAYKLIINHKNFNYNDDF